MTLGELIERLQEVADEFGDKADDVEVRLAHQPRWAFEYSIAGVALSTDLAENDDGCPECGAPPGKQCATDCERRAEAEDEDDDAPPVVYLAEGRQLGYAPAGIWEAAR